MNLRTTKVLGRNRRSLSPTLTQEETKIGLSTGEPDRRNDVGIILDHFNSRSVTVVDAHSPKPIGQSTMHIGAFGSFDSNHENYHDRSALSKVPCIPSTWMPDEELHFETAVKLATELQQALHESRIEIGPSGQHAGVQECSIREIDDGISVLRMTLVFVQDAIGSNHCIAISHDR